MRIAAAVYEAIRPTLESLQNDIRAMKSDIALLTDKVCNLTEEVEHHRQDTASLLGATNDTASTAEAICDKIDEHDNLITIWS